MKVLFVCTGNTCRSPMAEAAWHSLPAELQAGGSVTSAGILAQAGAPATAYAIAATRSWRGRLEEHRARRVDAKLLSENDLVCAVTADGARALRDSFPDHAAKVRVLGEFARYALPEAEVELERKTFANLVGVTAGELELIDIGDPFGGSLDDYETTAAQIRRAVDGLSIAIRDKQVSSA